MRDGLYQVTRGGVCAGFVVEGGRVTQQAPILRARGMGGQVRRVDDFQRVLVTGSRDFTDRNAVHQDLTRVLEKFGRRPDQVVVVNGMARGLDTVARSAALELGMRVEDHPAHWDRHGKAAGHKRNAEMVAAGARGAIAYPLGESRGTRGAMKLCEAAGIPVWNRTDPPVSGLGKR